MWKDKVFLEEYIPMPATAPGGAGDPPVVQVPDLQPSLSSTQVRASEVVSGGQVVDITTSTTWEALKPWLRTRPS